MKTLTACLVFALGLISLRAQTPPTNTAPSPASQPARFPIWSADLPGGKFSVDVAAITSVSTHTFRVEGVLRVVEATVALQGSVVARFYYAEPVQLVKTPGGVGQSALEEAQSKLKMGLDKIGVGDSVDAIWQKVEKSYPIATHAHTVEYRLKSEQEVEDLYKSVEQAWRLRQKGSFKSGDAGAQ